MNGYISIREASYKWGVSERRVNQYCSLGRIPGAERFGRSWAIPSDAKKPSDPRKSQSKKAGKGRDVMYNPQLETFLRVADAGSFNKAAEESYITPTAVIKQINLLEESLGVKLFDRSHRGLTLTKAGRSMYQDAKYIIQYTAHAHVKRSV